MTTEDELAVLAEELRKAIDLLASADGFRYPIENSVFQVHAVRANPLGGENQVSSDRWAVASSVNFMVAWYWDAKKKEWTDGRYLNHARIYSLSRDEAVVWAKRLAKARSHPMVGR